MSNTIILTEKRPSIDIEFILTSAEDKKYLEDNYKKFYSITVELSKDGLTRITTSIWTDENKLDEFLTDPVVLTMGQSKQTEGERLGIFRSIEVKTT